MTTSIWSDLGIVSVIVMIRSSGQAIPGDLFFLKSVGQESG